MPRISAKLAAVASPLSEYDFANLYLFRATHGYRVIDGDVPHLRGTTYDGVTHALPLAPLTRESAGVLLAEAGCIFPVDAATAGRATGWGMRAGYEDSDSDYVYDAARLAAMAGRVLKPKRSQARAFEAFGPSLVRVDETDLADALAVLDGWLGDVGRAAGDTDHAQCREALMLRETLGLDARLVRIGSDGEPVALLIAGAARLGQRAVHFAKGRRRFAGAYPWMFARFAAGAGVARLNFEQDLGKPGFRQAKQALDPVDRLRKYRIVR